MGVDFAQGSQHLGVWRTLHGLHPQSTPWWLKEGTTLTRYSSGRKSLRREFIFEGDKVALKTLVFGTKAELVEVFERE